MFAKPFLKGLEGESPRGLPMSPQLGLEAFLPFPVTQLKLGVGGDQVKCLPLQRQALS